MASLSLIARRVCTEHWNKARPCEGCPIERECSAPVKPLTEKRHDEHIKTINAAAARVEVARG